MFRRLLSILVLFLVGHLAIAQESSEKKRIVLPSQLEGIKRALTDSVTLKGALRWIHDEKISNPELVDSIDHLLTHDPSIIPSLRSLLTDIVDNLGESGRALRNKIHRAHLEEFGVPHEKRARS